jgi:hypothetical protein
MTVSRATIEEAVSRWEKRARADLWLSENLHNRAKKLLVDEMLLEINGPTVGTQFAVSDAEYDRIASEPPPRKGKNKG